MLSIYLNKKIYGGLRHVGLVDNACNLILPEIKKGLGFRSVFQFNDGFISDLTNDSSSNFSFPKEGNDCFRLFGRNGENKSKALKTDQPIG